MKHFWLILALAFAACPSDIGVLDTPAIGQGAIGSGAIGSGAIGGGAIGGAASGRALPDPAVYGTVALYYTADQPGASDVPSDLGVFDCGLMTAVGTGSPTWTEGEPDSDTAYWDFDGTHNWDDLDDCAGGGSLSPYTHLIVYRLDSGSSRAWGAGTPYGSTASTYYDYIGTASARATHNAGFGQWVAGAWHTFEGGDDPDTLQLFAAGEGDAALTVGDVYSGGTIFPIGSTNLNIGARLNAQRIDGGISQMVVWSSHVGDGEIAQYLSDYYPEKFGNLSAVAQTTGAYANAAYSHAFDGGRDATAEDLTFPTGSDVVFHVDGDTPGAADAPADSGSQDLGTFSVSAGAPSYTAPASDVPGFWSYGGADHHSLTAAGADCNDPCSTVVLSRRSATSSGARVFGFGNLAPWLTSTNVSGTQTDYRHSNSGAIANGKDAPVWNLVRWTANSTSDQVRILDTGGAGAAGSYATRFDLSGDLYLASRAGGADYWIGDIAQVVVFDEASTTVTDAEYLSAFRDKYPAALIPAWSPLFADAPPATPDVWYAARAGNTGAYQGMVVNRLETLESPGTWTDPDRGTAGSQQTATVDDNGVPAIAVVVDEPVCYQRTISLTLPLTMCVVGRTTSSNYADGAVMVTASDGTPSGNSPMIWEDTAGDIQARSHSGVGPKHTPGNDEDFIACAVYPTGAFDDIELIYNGTTATNVAGLGAADTITDFNIGAFSGDSACSNSSENKLNWSEVVVWDSGAVTKEAASAWLNTIYERY